MDEKTAPPAGQNLYLLLCWTYLFPPFSFFFRLPKWRTVAQLANIPVPLYSYWPKKSIRQNTTDSSTKTQTWQKKRDATSAFSSRTVLKMFSPPPLLFAYSFFLKEILHWGSVSGAEALSVRWQRGVRQSGRGFRTFLMPTERMGTFQNMFMFIKWSEFFSPSRLDYE